jgi:hypothetical protein
MTATFEMGLPQHSKFRLVAVGRIELMRRTAKPRTASR